MRIIITGGSGLIGRALTADLVRLGHEVIVLSRSPEQAHIPSGGRAYKWDGRTASGWLEIADGADAIVNLAGENIAAGRWTDERKNRIRASRLDAGAAVTEAVVQVTRKPGVVIQGSAVGYYGPRSNGDVAEQEPPGGDFLSQICVPWESSTASVEQHGVRRVVIRTGVVLSREGGALPKMLPAFRFGLGGRLGDGSQWFPWIHIADEVSAIRFLMEHESAHGPFNLTGPQPVTNEQFTRALGAALRRPALLPVPGRAVRLLFGEMSTILLDGQRAVPRRLLEMGFRFQYPQVEQALREVFTD